MVISIVTPLEVELVEWIRAACPDDEVLFEPSVLPPVRYPCDHRGDPSFVRGEADEALFWSLVERADVLFGIPGDTPAGLAEALRRAPRLRWIAATAAGAGEQVRAAQVGDALARLTVTSAAGAHGGMLAEFTMYGVLALRKDAQRLARLRAERRWDHYAQGELAGQTIAIVGMGAIGRAIAVRARAFGMYVVGVTRGGEPRPDADEGAATASLPELAPRADVLAITLPDTGLTRGLIGRPVIEALRPGAIVVNVGRGKVIDQAALIEALEAGTIAGAVLDVTDPEPLPPDNPLWTLPNVVFSPHTAALSVRENERIVELFLENMARFRRGDPLRNAVDAIEFY